MSDALSWDSYYLDLCRAVSLRSKDPSSKIGAIIVGPGNEVRSTGYNGFPRGVYETGTGVQGIMTKDGPSGLHVVDWGDRWKRPEKYKYVVHAEHNAILNAARTGVSTLGCILYTMCKPCFSCGLYIVQAGIKQVVIGPDQPPFVGAGEHYEISSKVRDLFREAEVDVRQL